MKTLITPEELVSRAKELVPSLWVEKHQIKNESGFPIEFDEHYFMRDLYDDMSPLQVWLKPPQIGATTAQMIKAFYVAQKKARQIIYTLPTQSDVEDIVGGSVNRIIAQNPILMSMVKDHDTVSQKSVGNSIIRYRGTFSAKQAMMVPSDLNIHDEVDASDPGVLLQYETRLQGKTGNDSLEKWRWYFSHPSLSGHGVDIYWQQSDKKEWFIKCNHCKEEQQLTWPENINVRTAKYVCSACKENLTKDEIKSGKWKPTATGLFSGYHISQLMCPWISAEKIIRDYETKDKQYFYNYVLGLPYISSENKIEPSVVLKNCTDLVNEQSDTIIIGVDTGLTNYVVLSNKQGIFHYETANYARIEELLIRWPSAKIVADQGGDLTPIRLLQQKYPGRVFLCYYNQDKKSKDVIRWGENDEFGIVHVDRNRMISLIVEQMRDIGRFRLNGSHEEWKEFADHFGNIYRELVVAKETIGKDSATLYGNRYVWKRNGDDHYVHALLYSLVGLDKYSQEQGMVVSPGLVDDMEVGRIF